MNDRSIPASYFEELYAADPDPWQFESSAYEREKYAATVQALPQPRYTAALEVGCSIGVLTHDLAERCETLLAIDTAASPIEEARKRCADRPSARFARMTVPDDWPGGTFDLIVLSKVVYYLCREDVVRLAGLVAASLAVRGDVMLVHWIGATNYPMSGDAASEAFLKETSSFTTVAHQHRTERFRLDVLTRI